MGEPSRSFRKRIFPALTGPGYGAAIRLLWETSRPLSLAVAGYAVAASVLPNLVLVAAGRLVGDIPAAARGGLRSPAGHSLIEALTVTGIAYAAALLLGPAQSALSSVVKWRLVYRPRCSSGTWPRGNWPASRARLRYLSRTGSLRSGWPI